MKLCRFVLTQDPEVARSGIFHDGRIYETDGKQAIGVHDPSKVRFLAPIGTPPAVRFFDLRPDAELAYRYGNPSALLDPRSEIDAPPAMTELDLEVRVGVVTGESGEQIDAEEAESFVLGVTIVLAFFGPEFVATDPVRACDLPSIVGPLLTTPDDLAEVTAFEVIVFVGEEERIRVQAPSRYPAAEMIALASRNLPIRAGEVLVAPPLPLPRLGETPLGRCLLPRDEFRVVVEPLGGVGGRIA
ncbi:MAG TPA: fumarylacetoacetate hydrolase family protein [Fimbriimonadaceae bacterium]|nr:fumarylacetoacetate hydrolase family protein [Fimbriimonadaceae bacterium]HRJ97953.1 fumarylacetoacetate hydrolase family protein [Fimbriimonadaceae bacterium]